jgi:MFS family permease
VRRSLLPRIDGLPAAYWFLWAGALVNRIGTFVIPFLALYLTRERHLSASQAGAIISMWGAGSLGAGPVGGFVADRWGRRRALVLSLAAGAAAMLVLGLVRATPHLFGAAFALGFFGEMYRPSVQAAIADLVPPGDRTRAFGFLYWAVNLGYSVAPVLAGWIAGRSFTLLFVGDAATTLLFALIVWLRVPETRGGRGAERVSWVAPYTDGLFLGFVLISFIAAAVFAQHLVGLPIDMGAHGIDAARFGTIICTNGLMVVLVQPSASEWLGRFPRSRVLATGAFLVGAGFGLTAFSRTPLAYVGSIAVWSLGEVALLPVTAAQVSDLSPPSLRASYQGMYQLAWGAAFAVAPILSGGVIARWGASALWAGCFAAGTLVALAQLALGGAARRRHAELERA